MPVKNTAIYLEECIDSIVKQTYETWELIAVDDHSDDQSFDILLAYASQDQRISVVKNEDGGIISALRTGYSISNGQLITRMDSDDIMSDTKLELFSNALLQAGTGYLAVGGVKYFAKGGIGEGYHKYEQWLNSLTSQSSNYNEIYKECSIPSPNWMCYRSDFEQVGAFYSEIYPEDYDLAFRFKYNNLDVIGLSDVTHHWRDYRSRTSRNDENYQDNRFTSLKIDYFLKFEYHENEPLILWGAGSKGKVIAKQLIARQTPFTWCTNNEKKIGKDIYGIKLKSEDHLATKEQSKVIISISQRIADSSIRKIKLLNPQHDYFHFC